MLVLEPLHGLFEVFLVLKHPPRVLELLPVRRLRCLCEPGLIPETVLRGPSGRLGHGLGRLLLILVHSILDRFVFQMGLSNGSLQFNVFGLGLGRLPQLLGGPPIGICGLMVLSDRVYNLVL